MTIGANLSERCCTSPQLSVEKMVEVEATEPEVSQSEIAPAEVVEDSPQTGLEAEVSNVKVDDDQPTALDQGTLFRAVSSGNLNAVSALLRNRKIDINGYDKEVSMTHHCTQNESTLESLRGFTKRFLRESIACLSHVFSASCRA